MNLRHMLVGGAFGLLVAGGVLLACCSVDKPVDPDRRIPDPVSDDAYKAKGKPRRGEWLHSFPESGQSFEEYRRECANLKSEKRRVFYIQPIGDLTGLERMTVETMGEYAAVFFGVPVKVLPTRPHYDNGYVKRRDQWNAGMIMGQMEETRPDDALVYVGITNVDLFSGELNFVFGVGSLRSRIGVYSLHRYHSKDKTLFLRRALKLMAHEAGHIFSIEHCKDYECVMNGANSLPEDDSHPMYLCPHDLRKLEWNVQFDRKERYRKLAEFCEENNLKDGEWFRARVR